MRSLLLAGLCCCALAPPAQAASKARYVFELDRVLLSDGVPERLEASVRSQFAEVIGAQSEIADSVGDDAPDPDKQPRAFERYLKRKKLQAFAVRMEVTEHRSEAIDRDGKHWLQTKVVLRLFGETVPGKSFAFTGDGAATLKIGVGKSIRDRDRAHAEEEVLKLATEQAVAMALSKLKKKSQRTRKRKKR